MKKALTFFTILLIGSGFIFYRSRQEPEHIGKSGTSGDFMGSFLLKEPIPLRVSIDCGWERNGQIPLILIFRDLEIVMQVGVGELAEAEKVDLETGIGRLLAEDLNLSFRVYEHNNLRTRLEPLNNHPIRFLIGPKGRVDFFVGCSRLKVERLHAVFTETTAAPGELYELVIKGPKVSTHKRFIFRPSHGVIYAASIHHRHTDNLALDTLPLPGYGEYPAPDRGHHSSWAIWAVKTAGKETQEKTYDDKSK